MTRFYALVYIAQTLLRARGEWRGPATDYADIDAAVNASSDLLGDGTREACEAAIVELKRRAGGAL